MVFQRVKTTCFLGVLFSLLVNMAVADDLLLIGKTPVFWEQTAVLAAPEARQAAAADERYVYAIDNAVVARYDRKTGQRVAASHGPAEHLNSGFLHAGKLYCAHSNYPKTPENSEIKVLDLESMELTCFHSFGESPHGSLTVAVFDKQHWWCVFARYGNQNAGTVLVKFDEQWQEQGKWTFPETVVHDLGRYSISGAIWKEGQLLATGHDKQVIYLLQLPEQGTVLKHPTTVRSPFPGQGIAIDPVTNGLVGIHRAKKQVVFAEPGTIATE